MCARTLPHATEKMNFTLGELVVLKTGGPAMLVVEGEGPTCMWVVDGAYVTRAFTRSDLISLREWMERALDRRRIENADSGTGRRRAG